jgi:ABC-type methionine transport system ATPase subunit
VRKLNSETHHILAFNNNLQAFKVVILMSSHDHEFIQKICTRVSEFTPNGIIERIEFEDYITDECILAQLEQLYSMVPAPPRKMHRSRRQPTTAPCTKSKYSYGGGAHGALSEEGRALVDGL